MIGSFTRHLQNPAEVDPFNVRVQAFLDDNMPDGPENAPAEEVKKWAEHFQREDQAATNLVANQETGDAFVAGHPEYIDNKANAALMKHEMQRMFGSGLHTLENFEAAYESLRESDFLALNKTELSKQQKAAAKQRYEAERARSAMPSEDELSAMPLDEIRMRATIDNQRRMLSAGERSGNDW